MCPATKPRKPRKNTVKSPAAVIAAGLVLAASGSAANAQISDDAVKIGVLTDMSSLHEIVAIDMSLMVERVFARLEP